MGSVKIPLEIIDDQIPEKEEKLVLHIDTRYNEMTTGEFVLVKIIDDDTTGTYVMVAFSNSYHPFWGMATVMGR